MEVPKAHHQAAMASIPPPEVVRGCPKGTTVVAEALQQEEMVRPSVPEPSLECPRCESINTNFCYYNNYSLSRPRYFGKGCRRYWTKGGSLRTVPVGGGCRNNKKEQHRRPKWLSLQHQPWTRIATRRRSSCFCPSVEGWAVQPRQLLQCLM